MLIRLNQNKLTHKATILTSWKTSLSQGRYTWRHSQVQQQLAITLEERRMPNNALPPPASRSVKTPSWEQDNAPQQHLQEWKQPSWTMQVDLDQKLAFPTEIITSNLRPDLVLWSMLQKALFIVELTVPWEAAMSRANKRLKYSDVAAESEQRG